VWDLTSRVGHPVAGGRVPWARAETRQRGRGEMGPAPIARPNARRARSGRGRRSGSWRHALHGRRRCWTWRDGACGHVRARATQRDAGHWHAAPGRSRVPQTTGYGTSLPGVRMPSQNKYIVFLSIPLTKSHKRAILLYRNNKRRRRETGQMIAGKHYRNWRKSTGTITSRIYVARTKWWAEQLPGTTLSTMRGMSCAQTTARLGLTAGQRQTSRRGSKTGKRGVQTVRVGSNPHRPRKGERERNMDK